MRWALVMTDSLFVKGAGWRWILAEATGETQRRIVLGESIRRTGPSGRDGERDADAGIECPRQVGASRGVAVCGALLKKSAPKADYLNPWGFPYAQIRHKISP